MFLAMFLLNTELTGYLIVAEVKTIREKGKVG